MNAIRIADHKQQDHEYEVRLYADVATVRLAKGDSYDVTRHADGRVTCTCGDFIFRRKTGRPDDRCKHGRACVEHGLFDQPEADATPDPETVATEVRENEEVHGVPARFQLADVRRQFGDEFADRVRAVLQRWVAEQDRADRESGEFDDYLDDHWATSGDDETAWFDGGDRWGLA